MPIYIDNSLINSLYSEFSSEKIFRIWNEIIEETKNILVTPSIVRRLIRRHLLSLVTSESILKIQLEKLHTWHAIYSLAQCIMEEANKEDNLILYDIGLVIELICEKSTKPSRQFSTPELTEISRFRNICSEENLIIPNHHIFIQNKFIDIFKFCIYCWRQPMAKKKFCHFHIPIVVTSQKNIATRKYNSGYQKGYRQQQKFIEAKENFLFIEQWGKVIITIFNTDISRSFAESSELPRLFPDNDRVNWLQKRRPYIFDMLGRQEESITENNLLDLLLKNLHSIDIDSSDKETCQIYAEINQRIRHEPLLIWPMLARAEACLKVEDQQRKKWGGRRSRHLHKMI